MKTFLTQKKDMAITEHRIDYTRKESPSPHNNQNAKHTQQKKNIKSRKGKKPSKY